MVARAYHDSSFVACVAPVAMLFIPCRGGVSHRPDEYASPEWIAGGGVDVAGADTGAARRAETAIRTLRDVRCNAVVCYASTCTRMNWSRTMSTSAKTRIVGAPVLRKEGVEKLLGRARYIDDIEREGMWYGATVRSTIPRGLIRSIGFDRAHRLGRIHRRHRCGYPRQKSHTADRRGPALPCRRQVNHCDEAIVLLAHPDKHKLREAVAAVHIEYEPLPPIFTIEESERQDAIVWGTDNLIKSFLLEKGDVDSVWANAAHIVEGEYRTGAQEHLYIENNGVIAEWSDADRELRSGVRCSALTTCTSRCWRCSICPKTKCA